MHYIKQSHTTMKKVTLLALACMYGFSSCHTPQPEEKEFPQPEYTIQFQIQPAPEIVSFQSTRSIPGNVPAEPGTSTTEEVVPSLFTCIEYAVYNNDTAELLRHKHYTEADEENEDFGTFIYDEFTPGNYKICVLAHSASKVSLTDGSATFNTVSDAFYASCEIEIDSHSTDQSVNILLCRVVSRIALVATDKVPQQAIDFHMDVRGVYNIFNLWEGEAESNTTNYSVRHTFTAAEKQDGMKIMHEFFTLVPPGNPTISQLATQTIDIDHNILHSRNITAIPIYTNKTTRYSCSLYSPGTVDGTFQLEIESEGAWEADENIDLPE